MIRLIGPLNESPVFIEGQKFTGLIDSGAQLSGICQSLVEKLKLKIHKLDTLLDIEGTGGINVPYLGYVEAKLGIEEIQGMDEDCLFLVIPDSKYTERVPVSIGTLHIDRCLEVLRGDEVKNLSKIWERALFPRYLMKSETIKDPDFDLDLVKGIVKLTKDVTLSPFETVHVSAKSSVKGHFKRVLVLMEKLEKENDSAVEPVNSYSILHPGSDRVQIVLHNLSARKVTVQAKSSIATISAANEVPKMLAPRFNEKESVEEINKNGEEIKMTPLDKESQEKLKNKLDLSGTDEWSEEQKSAAQQLFVDFGRLFALESNDLGHTNVVKHDIKLDDYTPFKERYHRIPPHMYEEVRKHLNEMIEVGAI